MISHSKPKLLLSIKHKHVQFASLWRAAAGFTDTTIDSNDDQVSSLNMHINIQKASENFNSQAAPAAWSVPPLLQPASRRCSLFRQVHLLVRTHYNTRLLLLHWPEVLCSSLTGLLIWWLNSCLKRVTSASLWACFHGARWTVSTECRRAAARLVHQSAGRQEGGMWMLVPDDQSLISIVCPGNSFCFCLYPLHNSHSHHVT